MNCYTRWAFALALLPVAACSSNSTGPMVDTTPPPPALAVADQAFVTAAAASDAGEIQSSQLAATKAHGPRVKAYAAKMVSDHTATSQKLMAIAQAKGVTASATPTDMAQKMEAKLEADKPRTFDRDYVMGQVASHKSAVQVFQSEIADGQDADLKAFAQATLPSIQQHLKMAQRLH